MIPLESSDESHRTPWVTWSFMLACAAVFVFEITMPAAAQHALFTEFGFVPARWSRLGTDAFDLSTVATPLTSMFMHAGLLHVAGNLLFLRVFGDHVEGQVGHGWAASLLVGSALGAGALQWAVDPSSTQPVVGASGAIAGTMAASVVLAPRARISVMLPLVVFFSIVEIRAVALVGVWFALQFFSGVVSLGLDQQVSVAYWSHVGGFGVGLVAMLAVRYIRALARRAPSAHRRHGDRIESTAA